MHTAGLPPDTFRYPTSRSGRVAVALIALALGGGGVLAATVLLVGGLVENETFIHAGWLVAPLFAMAMCGAVAAIAALMALVIEHERSIFVALALLVGAILAISAIDLL